MARIELEAQRVGVYLKPIDEILALHGSLHIPYSHIRNVSTAPVPNEWFRGVKVGTNLPGIKVAGSFFTGDGGVFYDFHDGARCLTFELDHEHYRRVVVQVDPEQDLAGLARDITARLTAAHA